MSKYEPLRHFLERATSSQVPMTFSEIEKVLGFPLPPSQTIRAWWSNNPTNNVMTKEWLAAGFKTEQVDIERRKLVFKRDDEKPRDKTAEASVSSSPKQRRRHPAFGALKDVTWIAPGVDLTEPADPEWADLIEDPNWKP
jgi:hypothetical protein